MEIPIVPEGSQKLLTILMTENEASVVFNELCSESKYSSDPVTKEFSKKLRDAIKTMALKPLDVTPGQRRSF